MKLPFWQGDKRRRDRELINEHLHILVTKSELVFIRAQAKEEIDSKNHLMRKMIQFYRKKVESEKPKEEERINPEH